MYGLMSNVRILLVTRTFIVFRTMGLPIAKAHPAKVMLTIEALHMITSTVLFDANVTLRTVLRVCTDVVGRFAVVGAFGEPLTDDLAIGWRVIVSPTAETEGSQTHLAGCFLRANIRTANDYLNTKRNKLLRF